MSELPEGWAHSTLGALVTHIVGGGTPSKAIDENFRGAIPFMTVKDMHERFVQDTQDHITAQALADSASTVVPADTLVVASRMSLGKIARPKVPVAINQDLKALFLHPGIDKTYVEYAWRANEATIKSKGTGTTVKGIRLEDIRGLEILVAPSAEQTRIADQLDTLLARIQACQDRLDAIPVLLKRFRQAVLDSALSGKITEDWREAESISLDEWEPTTIADIAEVGTGSTPLRSNGSFFSTVGTPWVTSSATGRPYIDSADEYVTPVAMAAHRLKVYAPGTLLIAMYGEGKTRGQVSELRIHAAINQACAAISVDLRQASVAFIKLALWTQYEQMRALAEGGNQPNLNLSKVKGIPVRLPPDREQTEIVRRVGALFKLADGIEARRTVAVALAQRLTPLTLAKAFRGELVPQDANDEPASALLARIAAERSSPGITSKARKPRASRPTRPPKESAAMTKSRQDEDVKGKPYLADHLRRIGAPATAEALFAVAELPVTDFYKQLAWEVAQGLVKNRQTSLEPGHAAR